MPAVGNRKSGKADREHRSSWTSHIPTWIIVIFIFVIGPLIALITWPIKRFFQFVPLPKWLTALLVGASVTGFTLGFVNDAHHWNSPFFTNVLSSMAVGPFATLTLVAVLERARRPIVEAPWALTYEVAASLALDTVGEAIDAFVAYARFEIPPHVPPPDSDHYGYSGRLEPFAGEKGAWSVDVGRHLGRLERPDEPLPADTSALVSRLEAAGQACENAMLLLIGGEGHLKVAGDLALAAKESRSLARRFEDPNKVAEVVDRCGPLIMLSDRVWSVALSLVPDLRERAVIPNRFGDDRRR